MSRRRVSTSCHCNGQDKDVTTPCLTSSLHISQLFYRCRTLAWQQKRLLHNGWSCSPHLFYSWLSWPALSGESIKPWECFERYIRWVRRRRQRKQTEMFAPPQEQDSVAAVEETLVKGEETKHFSDFVKPGSFQTDTTTKDYIDRGLWTEKLRSTSSKENCELKDS